MAIIHFLGLLTTIISLRAKITTHTMPDNRIIISRHTYMN